MSGAIGFVSAYWMSDSNVRRAAADRLRAAFAKELAFVRRAQTVQVPPGELERCLEDAFPRHEQAIEEYRPFVPLRSRDAYDQAWREYYEVGRGVRFHYGQDGGPELFVSRVENILSFAAPPRGVAEMLHRVSDLMTTRTGQRSP